MGKKQPLSAFRAKARAALSLDPRRKPRKVALLIGCKDNESKFYPSLYTPHEDISKMKTLLIRTYNYKEEDIKVLLDDGKHEPPTKANIIQAMTALVKDAKARDQHFFHYAGHGDQTPCEADDKTEDDGMDEAIIPCDATQDKDTWIIDNEMNRILVKNLPVNSQLIAIFDMCHSGTALDLKHYNCYNKELANGDVSTPQAGPSASLADVQDVRPAHPRTMQFSFHQGASIHVCRRKSRLEVDTQKVVFSAVPENTTGVQDLKGQRRYSVKTRKSTMRSELNHAPESSSAALGTAINPQTAESTVASSRLRNCSRCGGSFGERSPRESEDYERFGFVPPRLVTQNTLVQSPAGGIPDAKLEGLNERRVNRHLSDPHPFKHSTNCGSEQQNCLCFSGLQLDWLPGGFKRVFTTAMGSDRDKKKPVDMLSRRSTVSFTSTAPLSAFASRPGRRSMPAQAALSSITEGPETISPPSIMSALDDFPWCISPTSITGLGDVPQCLSPTTLSEESLAFSLRASRRCSCYSRLTSPERGQVITVAAARDEQLAFESSGGKSMTSALVEILEKDAHPTIKWLMMSLKAWLNNVSDEIRDYVDTETRKTKKRRSTKTPRKKSRKSGDDLSQDIIYVISEALKRANGGPIQEPVIGTENRIDMNTEIWNP